MADLSRPRWLYKFELKTDKWVFVPDDDTKEYGRRLQRRIRKLWKPPHHYVHLGPQGHVRALKTHLSSKYFARIDLKGFYTSINKTRVTRHLHDLFRDYDAARIAAVMSTVPNPVADFPKYVLPFGFVQSPLLAALCLYRSKLGAVIRELPRFIKRCVYVDDILISTKRSGEELQLAYDSLLLAAQKSGFTLNNAKLAPPSESIQVFNIEIAHQQLHIALPRLEEFQSAISSAPSENVVEGILSYVKSVNEEQELALRLGVTAL